MLHLKHKETKLRSRKDNVCTTCRLCGKEYAVAPEHVYCEACNARRRAKARELLKG